MAFRLENQGEGFVFLHISGATHEETVAQILQLNKVSAYFVVGIFGLETVTANPEYRSASESFQHIRLTLIAAVTGHLHACASDLALSCDLLVVSSSSSLTSYEVSQCFHPGPRGKQYKDIHGSAPTLPTGRVPADHLISLGVALRLTNDPREDMITVGSRLEFLSLQYRFSLRQLFVNSLRYRPRL